MGYFRIKEIRENDNGTSFDGKEISTKNNQNLRPYAQCTFSLFTYNYLPVNILTKVQPKLQRSDLRETCCPLHCKTSGALNKQVPIRESVNFSQRIVLPSLLNFLHLSKSANFTRWFIPIKMLAGFKSK